MTAKRHLPAAGSPPPAPASTGQPAPASRKWLLFVHQLPASPSNLRVRTWRRLQQMGALPVKQAVYVLPDSPAAREDFEWLKAEVDSAGGEATVFTATHVDSWADSALVEEFRRARQENYLALAGEIDRAMARLDVKRRPQGSRMPSAGRLADGFRDRLAALDQLDFFGSAGRDRVLRLLGALDERVRPSKRADPSRPGSGAADRTSYVGRLWVTRPRPGVDRMSSAWLLRRYVDPTARFGFAADRNAVPADAIAFDMFGVEFSHHAEGCTFETLVRVFDIHDAAVGRIACIVHDLDLKDGRFGLPEAATVGGLIDGLQLSTDDDAVLLERGITLFESLYQSFARSARTAGPRPVARPNKPRAAARPRTSSPGGKRRR